MCYMFTEQQLIWSQYKTGDEMLWRPQATQCLYYYRVLVSANFEFKTPIAAYQQNQKISKKDLWDII